MFSGYSILGRIWGLFHGEKTGFSFSKNGQKYAYLWPKYETLDAMDVIMDDMKKKGFSNMEVDAVRDYVFNENREEVNREVCIEIAHWANSSNSG